ncbi:MAG: 16S rRNA (cytidine(1402)-2'-O)-methyltransferase [Candidatus Aminicenantes bacterium RBG_16_63_16]|nr:MAG: 16S rRNA (cytidine(1402)-2'-O)-methyltransferase [Candidatus Aminicenantes bacterium RBG_16_63_16]
MGELGARAGSGTLYVVATPIGNLEDMTFRAVETLRRAGAIACEDTRQTLKLVTRYGIHARLISYYQPREGQRIPQILGLLREGKDVALVSDSGTPGISDPGFRLIREAIRAGVRVVPIPGPSAFVAAICASGLATHRFVFLGFPPPKREKLRRLLESLRSEEGTLIFYLPARKVAEFLGLGAEALGLRDGVIARELTKVHEEFIRGTIGELRDKVQGLNLRGEAIVLIAGAGKPK